MRGWLLFSGFYWLIGGLGGILGGHRVRDARRMRSLAKLGNAVDSRRKRPRRQEDIAEMLTKADRIQQRWKRPSRFGWPIAGLSTAAWIYSLVMADPGSPGASVGAARLVSSVLVTLATLIVAALLVVRYRAGADRPFVELANREKLALALSVLTGFVGFMVYTNAPLGT